MYHLQVLCIVTLAIVKLILSTIGLIKFNNGVEIISLTFCFGKGGESGGGM